MSGAAVVPQPGVITEVAAAVVVRGDGRVLLAQRPEGKPYAGYWEFPGGKLEPGESAEHALARELDEELGLEVRRSAAWLTQEFVYPHAHVRLHFRRVLDWAGEPYGHDGQAFAWQVPGAFDVAPLLPANTRVLAALALPPVYAITRAEDLGEDAMLDRAARAFAGGTRLAQLREKAWPAERIAAFARALVPLAHDHGARILLNGDADAARALGFDGVHWTSAQLARAAARPAGLLVAASCHTRSDLDRAGALDLDFAVLGPVEATPSHPQAPPLGWKRFGEIVEGTRVPVYALGGLRGTDLDVAIGHGAHGVALRSGAWEA